MALNLLSHLYSYFDVTSFNHELHILYVSRFTQQQAANGAAQG